MATRTPSSRPRRRTQAERRAETRAALLDATIDCLVEHGYANTTTGRIAELAGVSRGAQIPYFPNRAALVGAALAHLAERRTSALMDRFAGASVTLEEWLDAMWEEHQGPVFDATLELWVAARTDPELRVRLGQIERDVAAAVAAGAARAIGARARRPGFTEDLLFALATIRGVALLRVSSGGNGRAVARVWRHTRERLLRLLEE